MQLFSGSDKPRLLFFLLIIVKMPTIVGILTFMSRINFMLSRVQHKKFYNLETWFCSIGMRVSSQERVRPVSRMFSQIQISMPSGKESLERITTATSGVSLKSENQNQLAYEFLALRRTHPNMEGCSSRTFSSDLVKGVFIQIFIRFHGRVTVQVLSICPAYFIYQTVFSITSHQI